MNGPADRLAEKGWIRFPKPVPQSCLERLEKLEPFGNRGRRLTDMDAVFKALPKIIRGTLLDIGFKPMPLRAVGFNKSPEGNWSLPWHQDRVIALPEKTDNPDLKNWTIKNGVWHCEPPEEELAKLAFLYIAFDPMNSDTGQLELLEHSHTCGKIDGSDISEHVSEKRIAAPNLSRGEALLVSALLLHRSSPSNSSQARRALRIDFRRTNSPDR